MRRASAVGILARQTLGQVELPRSAEVVVRIDASAVGDEPGIGRVADVQGWGAVLTERLTELLAGYRVTVRPVVDARAMAPTDAYELPDAMRRVLVERWGADSFPFGSRLAGSCQGDHTVPYDHDAEPGAGQTHPDLMAPLSSFSHRVKTHGGWGCEQPEPGLLVWTTPHGWTVATTPAGTIQIGRPAPREHAWWLREPPDWLDDCSDDLSDDVTPPRQDPGPGRPALALDYLLTA